VIDVKNAQYSGLIAESTAKTPGSAAEAMLFDAYNPWAALVQLNSTHPLTGRRIRRNCAREGAEFRRLRRRGCGQAGAA
jgi:hypothetical protein